MTVFEALPPYISPGPRRGWPSRSTTQGPRCPLHTSHRRSRHKRWPIVVLVVVAAFSVTTPAAAHAEAAAPGWAITSTTYPTVLQPESIGHIELDVYNVGAEPSSGPLTVTDVLPPGLIATEAGDLQVLPTEVIGELGLWNCGGIGTSVVTCTNSARLPHIPVPTASSTQEKEQHTNTGVYLNEADASNIVNIGIAVKVQEKATTGMFANRATVAGGGASAPASTAAPLQVAATQPPFGFQRVDGWFSNADGTIDTQAGSHPYEATFTFDLATEAVPGSDGEKFRTAGGINARNIIVNLPRGLVGNPTAVPRCTRQAFDHEECQASAQIGFDIADISFSPRDTAFPPFRQPLTVFNLVPPPGVPAQFAFTLMGVPVFLDAGVRSGGDYGITEHADNLPQVHITGNRLVLWGEPANPAHDPERFEKAFCHYGCTSGAARVPFLTLPTACEGPQQFKFTATTWESEASFVEPMSFLAHEGNGTPTGFTGCDQLGFNPTISVKPETTAADTPSGLTVEVKTPQEGLLNGEGLATSSIKDTTVTLPAGVAINPGQAPGLQTCPDGPASTEAGHERYGDNLPLSGENGEEERFDGPANCPSDSQVGTVQIATPLLKEKLEGGIYVMQSNPPDLKLLVAASGEGVNLKLIGTVHGCESAGEVIETGQPGGSRTCQAPGQLITTFAETPQLPFTTFKLSFSGGARAALVTPSKCGEYAATSDFTPWSMPAVGDVFPSSDLAVSTGPGGTACPGALPFTPSLTAGATTDQAGGFTNFSLLLTRGDDQQRIDRLSFTAPPGLTAYLSKVQLCTNAQAETNACPEASKIGHTVVESGPGPYPLVVPEPGQPPAPIYLTEGYDGAPFGLSVVVPLKVGPFELPTQRVRAKIEVDPQTAQITVTTNELPQQVAGVPTDLREVDAVIERPEFMVDPTNCNAQQFSGTAYGSPPPGQTEPPDIAPIASDFKVEGCGALKFEPKFSVSTSAHTSKADGASLNVKLSYPKVPQGRDANIKSVKIELPKALPSRLTTLQKACTAKAFETNPASCPVESIIGHAVVHTQVLPVPLEGPAYFVSHGGEAFPSLEIVLQGYGVTVDLVGATFISKSGITSTNFKATPDVPFETFELNLPQGKYSALAANGNLCQEQSALKMPTDFVAQNGATLDQDPRIAVTGCKSAIRVVKHSVKGHTATLEVSVPAAGKLVASGRGLSKAAKKAGGAGTVTVKVSLTKSEAAFVEKFRSRHKGRRLLVKVHLTFTPKKGARLKTSTTVFIG
jgi:hypothetical protein